MSEEENWLTRISGVFRAGAEGQADPEGREPPAAKRREMVKPEASRTPPTRASMERSLATRQARVNELEQQLAIRDEAVARARFQLRHTSSEYDALKQDHEELHRMYEDAVALRKEVVARLNQIEAEHLESRNELEHARAELRRTKLRLAGTEGEKKQLRQQVGRVESELLEARAVVRDAQADLAKIEAQCQRSAEKSVRAEAAAAEARDRCDAVEREKQVVEDRYTRVLHSLVGPELVAAAFELAAAKDELKGRS